MGGIVAKVRPNKSAVPKKKKHVQTAVEQRLLEALRNKVAGNQSGDSKKPKLSPAKHAHNGLNKVLLNFQKIQKTFKEIKQLFDKADINGDKSLSFEEVKSLMNELCPSVDLQLLEDLFNEADISSDGDLQFKEFISLIAVANMLDIVPELSHPEENGGVSHFEHVNRVKKAFDLATEMYLSFDREVKGTISFEEVERTFDEADDKSDVKRKAEHSSQTHELMLGHWKSMDWDNDGSITYQEFMYTFASWISDLNPDDDDDEDE